MSESVSVIITCYNLQNFIRQSIQSVISQDYAGEVQIVVVDDCSIDESRDILTEFSGIDTVLQQENGGVMKAMIAGLRVARNDVVFFLDGDDVWHPQKLSRCMEKFDNGTKFCTHDLWYMGPDAQEFSRASRVSQVLSSAQPADQDALITRGILSHLDYVWLGSAFGIRRSLGAVQSFIEFCEARDYLRTCYQDWPLATWVVLQAGGKAAYVDQKLFGYRLHDSNYSSSAQTLDKLTRNFGKSLDTIRLIEEMMATKVAAKEYRTASRHVRGRYELLFACTQESRTRLLGALLRNLSNIEPNRSGLKTIARASLSLLFGAKMAHRLVESHKRRSAVT